jgi:hypothetical protein
MNQETFTAIIQSNNVLQPDVLVLSEITLKDICTYIYICDINLESYKLKLESNIDQIDIGQNNVDQINQININQNNINQIKFKLSEAFKDKVYSLLSFWGANIKNTQINHDIFEIMESIISIIHAMVELWDSFDFGPFTTSKHNFIDMMLKKLFNTIIRFLKFSLDESNYHTNEIDIYYCKFANNLKLIEDEMMSLNNSKPLHLWFDDLTSICYLRDEITNILKYIAINIVDDFDKIHELKSSYNLEIIVATLKDYFDDFSKYLVTHNYNLLLTIICATLINKNKLSNLDVVEFADFIINSKL